MSLSPRGLCLGLCWACAGLVGLCLLALHPPSGIPCSSATVEMIRYEQTSTK